MHRCGAFISSLESTLSSIQNETFVHDTDQPFDLVDRLFARSTTSFNGGKKQPYLPEPPCQVRLHFCYAIHFFELLTSSSSLPPIPPGFHIVCRFNNQVPVDSVGAYMVIIKAIVRLSAQPWSGKLDDESIKQIVSPDNRVIFTSVFLEDAQPGYVILALLETAHRMYLRNPGYYAVETDVLLVEENVGYFYVGPHVTEIKAKGDSVSLVTITENLTDTSGVIMDPIDSKFRISWEEKGTVVHPVDVFSAAIDGLATAAHQNYNEPCDPANGLSWNGRVIFGIHQTGDWKLLCKAMVTTFDLLVEQVVRDKPGIQEMEFTLIYDGAVTGLGYISSVTSNAGNNGVGGIATS